MFFSAKRFSTVLTRGTLQSGGELDASHLSDHVRSGHKGNKGGEKGKELLAPVPKRSVQEVPIEILELQHLLVQPKLLRHTPNLDKNYII